VTEIEYRRLEPSELGRVSEIDRSETIDAVYVQRGSRLELRHGDFSSPPWDPVGTGEHSVSAMREALEAWSEQGAAALGAFDEDRLVGIGLVLPHLRPSTAQLAFLYVSAGYRDRGLGGRLAGELEWIARDAGDRSLVVSATPSLNTVRFYRRRGFEPMDEPLPELYELEPEDVHLEKRL
jgi:ribosomal protein S18 acetylase RimI-like enzyme